MAALEILEILSPGILTTVQDLGRYGYGRYGVAPSGALDSFALRIANLLVGNAESQAGLETTLLGVRAKALADVPIAVTGADLQPLINKRPLRMWRCYMMKKGEILSFYGPSSGCRAYIALGGGIGVPPVLGSKSTNLPSGFGGYLGRRLQAGDILRLDSAPAVSTAADRRFRSAWIPVYSDRWKVRVLWGPQDGDFTAKGRFTFENTVYRVSSSSDRTGIRLQGAAIEKKASAGGSIISEGVVCGAVQIPGDGQPIIVLGETVTGGYRKIATVIAADLPLLGQVKPDDEIQFTAVSMDMAHRALQAAEEKIRRFKDSLAG